MGNHQIIHPLNYERMSASVVLQLLMEVPSPLSGVEELSRVPQEFYHKTGKAAVVIQDSVALPALHAELFERKVP